MRNLSLPLAHEFDQYAGGYEEQLAAGLALSGEGKAYFSTKRIEWVKRCLDELRGAPRTLVDYGCGMGDAVPELLAVFKADSVVGVDPSSRLIERAARDFGGDKKRFIQLAEYRAPETVDLVYCSGVFHHIVPANRAKALHHIWKPLRPGGYLAFWENNPWNPGTRYIMSRIPFDRDAVPISSVDARRLLQESGFHIVRSDYLFVFPRWFKALRWIEPMVSHLPLGGQYLILARKSGRLAA